MEHSKTMSWQQRAQEIDERFVKLAQGKGSLTSREEVVRFLVMAICGEAGELANLAKKMWRGDAVDAEALQDEIADIRIYLEHLCRHLGIDIDEACDRKLDIVAERLSLKERQAAESMKSVG